MEAQATHRMDMTMTNTNFSREELATVLGATVEAILWTTPADYSGNDDTSFLDLNYDMSDVDDDSMEALRNEVAEWMANSAEDIRAAVDHPAYSAGGRVGFDPFGLIGHDYALTREHHGAGFWDRGIGELGDRLTESCQASGGDFNAFLGEDGTIKFDL